MQFSVIRNDISLMDTDAIVVPSNSYLKPGHGTAKTVYEKAGENQLSKACEEVVKRNGRFLVGDATHTLGFDLPAKYIVHAIVPRWRGGRHEEDICLAMAYISSLREADNIGCKSIAIPILSAGNNGFEPSYAIKIAIESILEYQPKYDLQRVILVPYDYKTVNIFKDSGIEVEELIDQQYVLQNDERYKLPLRRSIEKNLDQGAKGLRKFADDSKTRMKEMFDDPIVKERVNEKAADVLLNKETLKTIWDIGSKIVARIKK